MNKASVHAAILGSFDGLTSVLGIILAAALGGAPGHLVLLVALGGAVAATVSMAGGEFLAANDLHLRDKLHSGITMGAATFVGTLLPVLPYVLCGGLLALCLSLALSLVLALAIAETRHRLSPISRGQAYLETGAVLLCAGALVVLLTRLAGGGTL